MGTGMDRRGRLRMEARFVVAIALVVFVGALTAPPGRAALDPFGYLLLALPVAAIALRGRLPVTVLLVTSACLLAYQLRGYPGVIPAVPVVVAVYVAVLAGHRRVAIATVSAGFLAVLASDLTVHSGLPFRVVLQDRFLLIGWIGAAAMAAEGLRHRRAYLAQVERRAEEAERTREEVALRRAGEERLRIARELHDSLTHSISLIKVQVGVAVHLARKNGEPVPDVLLAIQEASGDAMRELRATLEVLRDNVPDGSGLDRLEDLVERARTAGLPTTVTVNGPRRGLPPMVDRTAYRIVQEALTNITRHAGPATAAITMSYRPDSLTVQVDDDGRAAPAPRPGTAPGVGLVGMRERVTALGGSLSAGPRPLGGFTVRAELPISELPTADLPIADLPTADPAGTS